MMRRMKNYGKIRILSGILAGTLLSLSSGCTLFIAKTAYKAGKEVVKEVQSRTGGYRQASSGATSGDLDQE